MLEETIRQRNEEIDRFNKLLDLKDRTRVILINTQINRDALKTFEELTIDCQISQSNLEILDRSIDLLEKNIKLKNKYNII